jgi:hypothetical protein
MKLEAGKTAIGTDIRKDANDNISEYTVYYGNILLPALEDRFGHLPQDQYDEMLKTFLRSKEGQKYDLPTKAEVKQASIDMWNRELQIIKEYKEKQEAQKRKEEQEKQAAIQEQLRIAKQEEQKRAAQRADQTAPQPQSVPAPQSQQEAPQAVPAQTAPVKEAPVQEQEIQAIPPVSQPEPELEPQYVPRPEPLERPADRNENGPIVNDSNIVVKLERSHEKSKKLQRMSIGLIILLLLSLAGNAYLYLNGTGMFQGGNETGGQATTTVTINGQSYEMQANKIELADGQKEITMYALVSENVDGQIKNVAVPVGKLDVKHWHTDQFSNTCCSNAFSNS